MAASGGAEVKNLGDGMMVVFSATSSALECAVAMQQGVERENRASQTQVGLRIGVSCGEATREDDDYFGDPVIEASRLCARSEGGQVLVSDLVKGMAGRRSAHRLEPVGALELKGLLNPVESYEVVWEPLGTDADEFRGVPLPARLAHRPTVGVIGRADELAVLDEAAKTAEVGQGCRTVPDFRGTRSREDDPRRRICPSGSRAGGGGASRPLQRGARDRVPTVP